MIAVDASALLAIFFSEPEAGDFSSRILGARQSVVSAGSALEGYIIVSARTHNRASDFLQMVNDLDLRTVSFDEHQLSLARAAFDRYGKGRHPAKLNFGDCISYALAKAEGLALLFKGDDFAKTDVDVA